MSLQKKSCKHSKAEEQYICLEASCLSKKEFKLDCLRCLMQNHPHSDSITHIQDILIEAQKSQQTANDLIEQNLKFCQSQQQIVEAEIQDKRKKLNEWLDQFKKNFMQEIEEYENQLKLQKQNLTTIQLTSDNLQDLVDFRNLNLQSYEQQNEIIKKGFVYNITSFNEYFLNQYERISKNYLLKKLSLQDLPKLEQTYQVNRVINYEKCTTKGCSGIDKSKLCLEKTCLLTNDLALQCPQCLTSQHWVEQKFESHNNQFVLASELWDLQNKYIDEVEKFCDEKESDISKVSQELQELIIEYQKLNEQKLQQFMLFIIEKEKQILQYLSRFKSQYQKEKFIIYKDLLLQTDYSILADIQDLEFNFKNISEQFKKQYQNEIQYNQQQFQELWLKGSCHIQTENILKKQEKFQNPISQKIQDLQKQIANLESQKHQCDIIIETIKKQSDQKQKDFDKNLMNLVKDNGRLEQTQQFQKIIEKKLNELTSLFGDAESEDVLNSIKQLNKSFNGGGINPVSITIKIKQWSATLQEKLEKTLPCFQELAHIMHALKLQEQSQNL